MFLNKLASKMDQVILDSQTFPNPDQFDPDYIFLKTGPRFSESAAAGSEPHSAVGSLGFRRSFGGKWLLKHCALCTAKVHLTWSAVSL